jgi:hypothetical protein
VTLCNLTIMLKLTHAIKAVTYITNTTHIVHRTKRFAIVSREREFKKKRKKKIAEIGFELTILHLHSSSETTLPTALRAIFNVHYCNNWIFTSISI